MDTVAIFSYLITILLPNLNQSHIKLSAFGFEELMFVGKMHLLHINILIAVIDAFFLLF